MNTAFISEIYASIQGEGPHAGERQVFVRLAGCPLRCNYCDTPGSLTVAGHRRWSVDEALGQVRLLAETKSIRTVSITGGEPLVQPLFLKEFLSRLKKEKFRVYLETAGVHPEALRQIISSVDVVSMDMKLPSATAQDFWRKHAAFLKVAGKKVFVKVVLEKNSQASEIEKVVALLSKSATKPQLIFQPATPIAGEAQAPAAEQIAEAYSIAVKKLPRVLVMPQQHKQWGVR